MSLRYQPAALSGLSSHCHNAGRDSAFVQAGAQKLTSSSRTFVQVWPKWQRSYYDEVATFKESLRARAHEVIRGTGDERRCAMWPAQHGRHDCGAISSRRGRAAKSLVNATLPFGSGDGLSIRGICATPVCLVGQTSRRIRTAKQSLDGCHL